MHRNMFGLRHGQVNRWGGSSPPHAVESMAALRQVAATPGRSCGVRGRDLQLQPRLRARDDGGRAGRTGPTRLSALGCRRSAAALLSHGREIHCGGMANVGGQRSGFPEVEGRRTLATRATNRVADWVLGVCSYDAVVAEKFFRVNNFLDPQSRLLHPAFVFQLATAKLRNRRRRELLPVAGQKVA